MTTALLRNDTARAARRARAALPFAQHVTLPGCGHVPFPDDPDRCVEMLLGRPITTTKS